MTETLPIGAIALDLNLQEQNDGGPDATLSHDARRSILLASPFIAAPKEATAPRRSLEHNELHSPHSRTSTTNGRANSIVRSTIESAGKPGALIRLRDDPDGTATAEPENASSGRPMALSLPQTLPGSPTSITKQRQNKT